MQKLSLIVAGTVLLAPHARADVLHKSRVPAGARWIAHVDIERLLGSELFTAIKNESGADFEIGLDDIDELCGLNPMTDIKSVTFFSTNESDEHTVGVITISSNVDNALACFQREEGYHTLQVGARTLHSWSKGVEGDSSGAQYGYILPIAGSTDRIALVAGKPDALIECAEVIENGAPSLASSANPNLSASPSTGSILFAAAGEPLARLADIPPASAIVKMAQAWTFEVGEVRHSLYADLWIKTSTSEEATQVQQILQGATAMLSLLANDPAIRPNVQSLMSALQFNANGNQMTAQFRYNVQELLGLLKALDHHDGDESDEDGGEHVRKEKKVRHEKKVRLGDEK